MEDNEKNKSFITNSQLTLFKFELNRSQTSLFLILSLMGIFMLPFYLAQEIFLSLFQFIFSVIPNYIEEPGIRPEGYLIRHFIPIITNIILFTIFLSLSIYGFRRILKHKIKENGPKRKTISQERTVNWLGLKISHGQSLFIFIASLAGLFFILQLFLQSYIFADFSFGLFESLFWIPIGQNSATTNLILLDNVPLVIIAIFFILCIYSLFITRRGKPMTPAKKITKNYGLIIFISSFVVFIFLSAKIFFHLAMFNQVFSNLLGISYHAPNSYQNNDFIRTFVFLCLCLVLMITSYFLKERNQKEIKASDEFSWLLIKLTPHRVIILISSALIPIIFFTHFYLVMIFMMGGLGSFGNASLIDYLFDIILIPIIIFCYYPIGKILKKHRFDKAIANINNSREFKTNWFKFRLDKINSIILLSVCSALVVFYLFQLVIINMNAQAFYSDFYSFNSYTIFSFPFLTILIFLAIIINIYTIIKTLPSIRSFKSKNLKKVDDENRRND